MMQNHANSRGMGDPALTSDASRNSAAQLAEADHSHTHSQQRFRVRHKRRVPWYRKQASRRMKLLIFLSAVLAVLMAFAILNYMNMPTMIPQQ